MIDVVEILTCSATGSLRPRPVVSATPSCWRCSSATNRPAATAPGWPAGWPPPTRADVCGRGIRLRLQARHSAGLIRDLAGLAFLADGQSVILECVNDPGQLLGC